MRILHIGDISQQGSHLAEAQRGIGHHALVMAQAIDSARFGMRQPDVDIDVRHGILFPMSYNAFLMRHRRFIDSFDILHVHGGVRLWQLAFRWLRPPLVTHMHGSETRIGFGLNHLARAGAVLYSTPDLAALLPSRARWLPQAVPDIPHGPPAYDRLRILHAPTDPRKKDTRDILDVVSQLWPKATWRSLPDLRLAEGVGVEFRITSGPVAHDRLLALIERSNLVVDHLGTSPTVGITSIEAMLMERAAIGGYSISDYARVLKSFGYEKPPMFHADGPGKLAEVLRSLHGRPERLAEERENARRYARSVHDPVAVARQVLHIYQEVLG